MTEEDGKESSNICFFEYSFLKPLEKIGKEEFKIKKVEALNLFKNVMSYHMPIEYKLKTQPWLWCISNFQEEKINGNKYLFGMLNRVRPKEIEKIFDWDKYQEAEAEINEMAHRSMICEMYSSNLECERSQIAIKGDNFLNYLRSKKCIRSTLGLRNNSLDDFLNDT